MNTVFKTLLIIGLTFLGSQLFAQPYIKFEEHPPMEIPIGANVIKGIKIKYNIPEKSFAYVSLFKDGEPIGNQAIEITRGKRVIDCSILIFKDKSGITKKSEYEYRIKILKEKANHRSVIVKGETITGVKAVKAKK